MGGFSNIMIDQQNMNIELLEWLRVYNCDINGIPKHYGVYFSTHICGDNIGGILKTPNDKLYRVYIKGQDEYSVEEFDSMYKLDIRVEEGTLEVKIDVVIPRT